METRTQYIWVGLCPLCKRHIYPIWSLDPCSCWDRVLHLLWNGAGGITNMQGMVRVFRARGAVYNPGENGAEEGWRQFFHEQLDFREDVFFHLVSALLATLPLPYVLTTYIFPDRESQTQPPTATPRETTILLVILRWPPLPRLNLPRLGLQPLLAPWRDTTRKEYGSRGV